MVATLRILGAAMLVLLVVVHGVGLFEGISGRGTFLEQLAEPPSGGGSISYDDPFSTWHEGRTRVHFECAFDSSRGFPGEGPGVTTSGWDIQRRNRKSAYGVGYRREFGPAGGGETSNPPDKRQKFGRGQHIPRGRVSSAGSGVLEARWGAHTVQGRSEERRR